MVVVYLSFYLFATISVISALNVILQRNPVHSVLWLILTFFNSAGLFILLGAEFLAMVLVVVYVGAVAVLFLFVVMMLDINVSIVREGFMKYLPIASLIIFILLAELVTVFYGLAISDISLSSISQPIPDFMEITNTEAIGLILYTDYIYLFQSSGVILLVSMVGAIVLTHRKSPNVKRQNIEDQVTRNPSNTLEIVKVRPGKGLS